MPGLTNRQRLHLALPLLAIGATLATFAIVGIVGSARPTPPPEPPDMTAVNQLPTFAGMLRPDQATIDEWLLNFPSGDELDETQRLTAAGVTRDGRWGYLAATPRATGELPGRYIAYKSDTQGWLIVGQTIGRERVHRCTQTPPAQLAALLKRDRFTCGYI